MRPAAISVFLLVCLAAGPAAPDFYRYVREDGSPVFVDDIGKIPPEYREGAKRYSGPSRDAPSEAGDPAGDALPPALRQPGEIVVDATPVLVRNDRVFVQATIGYGVLEAEVRLLLDTGASVTTLFRSTAERVFMRGLQRTTGKTAAGRVVPVELATLDHIRVGPHRRERLRVGIVDTDGRPVEYDGLLGMDFLRGLEFDIDFDREIIVWR